MKKLFLFSLVLFMSIALFADFVPKKDAERVARSYYYQGVNSIKTQPWDEITLNCIYNPTENIDVNYYVFNINGDEGFIIVPSDNKIQPILAYSFEGGFNNNNMSPGQKEMLNYYAESIEFASKNEVVIEAKDHNQWEELLNYDYKNGIKQKTTSPILLKDIKWNQDWPYNSQCPADANGMNGHVPVGCVATAMLQVMKYYNWPYSGEGARTQYNWLNGGYGTFTINFASQTYDWNSIPNQASAYVNEEAGKINFHAAVGVAMFWGADGSSSQTSNIVTALKTHFKYSTSAEYVQKDNYAETDWKNLIKAQINNKMPVVYSGRTSGPGHAWNCDGYSDDEFHMNWGWGGYGNGYYTLDNLISTATGGGEENNFSVGQQMVINIYPRESYPEYCNGTTVITGVEGSFGDGSANENYQYNQSCVYVIEPLCGKVISLSFNDFNLGNGDQLNIFDGDENSSTLIAVLDANNMPGNNTYTTNSGALTLKFDTDATSTGDGWNVDYSVKNCVLNNTFTASSGTISDGSGACHYNNSTVCSWVIQPENADWISLTFDEFALAGNIDYVKIYKTSQSASNQVAMFNASNVPSGPIVVDAAKVVVLFFTDGEYTSNGWKINYDSNITDVEQNKLLSNFSVMPNPGNLNSRLEFSITDNSETTIMVTNLLGEVIAVKGFSLLAGLHNFALSEIIDSKLGAGVYLITINGNNQIKTQKLVVVE